MSTAQAKPQGKAPEYGPHREKGVAGPGAAYILRSLRRFRLRGEGYLKVK